MALVDARAFSNMGLNKALSSVENVPSGSLGIVESISTNVAGDGRIVCASFEGRMVYVREECLKVVSTGGTK